MNRNQINRKQRRGRGRTFFGLGLSGMALFWLAKKIGWLGVGSSGIIWPILVICIGLAIAVGSLSNTSGTSRGEESSLGGCRK